MDKNELIKVTYHVSGRHTTTVYIKFNASFNVIWKKVIEDCPFDHQTNNLEMFWIDEEKNKMIIDDKESFDRYLQRTLGLSPKQLHVRKSDSNTKSVKTAANSYNSVVHDNIECDGCYMLPIVGHMYKCLKCPNYVLCQDCVLNKIHMNHNILQISTNNPSTLSTSKIKEKAASSQNPVNENNSIKSDVSNNASEYENSSSSWEDASDVSSDVSSDEENINNAKFFEISWGINKGEKILWRTTDDTSDEDSDSDSSSWETIDYCTDEELELIYFESSSDEENDEESDEDNSNYCITSKYHKAFQYRMNGNETDDSSDGEINKIESDDDNPNCSETNKENEDNDDEINNLLDSFVIIYDDDSSDRETNNIETDNDNLNCSETNKENEDSDDEFNNLLDSFVII